MLGSKSWLGDCRETCRWRLSSGHQQWGALQSMFLKPLQDGTHTPGHLLWQKIRKWHPNKPSQAIPSHPKPSQAIPSHPSRGRSSIQEGKALAATLPGAVYIQADCSSREGCEGLIQEVAEKCGQLDLLVCHSSVIALMQEFPMIFIFCWFDARIHLVLIYVTHLEFLIDSQYIYINIAWYHPFFSCVYWFFKGHPMGASQRTSGNAGVGKVIPHDKLELIDDELLGIVDNLTFFFAVCSWYQLIVFACHLLVRELFDERLHIEHFVAESSVASSCWLMTSCGPSLHRAAGQQRHEKWSARRASTTTRASSSGTNWLSWRCRSRSWTDRTEW